MYWYHDTLHMDTDLESLGSTQNLSAFLLCVDKNS